MEQVGEDGLLVLRGMVIREGSVVIASLGTMREGNDARVGIVMSVVVKKVGHVVGRSRRWFRGDNWTQHQAEKVEGEGADVS